MERYKKSIGIVRNSILNDGVAINKLADLFALCSGLLKNFPTEREYVFSWTNYIKESAIQQRNMIVATDSTNYIWCDYEDLYWQVMLFEAQNMVLDSYLLYLERKRDKKDRYYEPRRRCFLKIGLIQALQDMLDDKLDVLSISLPPGTGKAQPLYSKVLTPNGFVNMGDVKVGDKVIAGNGKESKIIGVYPQGKKKVYEFTLDDGSKVRSSEEHLWRVQTREDRRGRTNIKNGCYRIATTKEIIEKLKVSNWTRLNYSIDYVNEIEFKEKDLKLHPYIIGVLIGDGCLRATPEIATNDKELLELVDKFLPNGYFTKHKDRCTYSIHGHDGNNCKAGSAVTKAIKYYGLFGKKSEDKFIPKDYLYASVEQRRWLLKGLMDTDGTCSKNVASFCTVSKQLADDVIELVHSLGGYASVSIKKTGYKDKCGKYIKCKDAYNVTIQFNSNNCDIFAIERKSSNYKPKRNSFKRFIKEYEYVGEEECQCIMIDDPCHLYITDNYIITHNTTLEKFLHSGICGWFPKDYNLFYSHSGDITRMYYDGVADILQNPDEYTWGEIFPDCKVTSTNAKLEQININKYKPFPNVQCTSVGAKNAGKVRANKFLLCDDMIPGIEVAMNKKQLDKVWEVYSVDARQRKVTGCKEIHIATRWSVHDVIGRLQRVYEGNERCKFIAVPDIDPITGESNFEFDINPFTVEFYHDQELLMDDISYRCLYKNEPIEREGLLYHEDELRRYLDLPLREPDAIIGVCDTKAKGTDFMVLPVMYQYDDDFYMVDCICTDSSDFGVQYGRLANLIVDHNMQQCEFESNTGGDRVAFEVEGRVNQLGGRCNITTKPTETNKETKIIVNSDWIKKHILFKDKSLYGAKEDYGVFMTWLLSYSVAGKNAHDDVPDALANFSLYVTRGSRVAKAEAVVNPFRSGYYG